MKRVIKVSAGYSGKIATGPYQNANPSFYAEETVELDDVEVMTAGQTIDEIIRDRQRQLQELCTQNFEQEAVKAKIQKIQEDRKDFRWYPLPTGERVPSVTSILNYDTNFLIDEEELKQHAAQGTIIHAQVDHFIKTGEWKQPHEIDGLGAELFLVKSGTLKLALEGWDFPSFLKKYPVEKMEPGLPVVNMEHKYGGTPDISFCLYEGVPTIADIKKTPEKVKNFQQMAAYARADNALPAQQMMIIPLNDKTDQGFSKPIISKEIDKYFDLFLYKRKQFQKVYGV